MTPLYSANFAMVCALMGLTFFLLVQSLFHHNHFLKNHLSVFYAANLISQIDELMWLQSLWKIYPWLTNLYIPFLYLLAPSFYLYAKGLTQVGQKHRFFYVRHWSGFFVACAICLPYYLLDNNIKLERLLAPKGTLEHLSYITYGPVIAMILFIPFTFVYLIITLKLLSVHLNSIKAYFSNIENKDLSWLRWSIIVLFIVYVVSIIQLFLPSSITDRPFEHLLFMVFEFMWMMVISLFAIKQKNIRQPKPQDVSTNTNKYVRSKMSISEKKRIEQRLNEAMNKHNIQRNPTLTLRYLADHINVSENHISQVLNAQIGMGFYDYVNHWRIKDACRMIQNSSKNLLEIAYAVGFNSRSTFNAAFKKHANETPSGFRKKLNTTSSHNT